MGSYRNHHPPPPGPPPTMQQSPRRGSPIPMWLVPTGTIGDDGVPRYRGFESLEAAAEFARGLSPIPDAIVEISLTPVVEPRS